MIVCCETAKCQIGALLPNWPNIKIPTPARWDCFDLCRQQVEYFQCPLRRKSKRTFIFICVTVNCPRVSPAKPGSNYWHAPFLQLFFALLPPMLEKRASIFIIITYLFRLCIILIMQPRPMINPEPVIRRKAGDLIVLKAAHDIMGTRQKTEPWLIPFKHRSR